MIAILYQCIDVKSKKRVNRNNSAQFWTTNMHRISNHDSQKINQLNTFQFQLIYVYAAYLKIVVILFTFANGIHALENFKFKCNKTIINICARNLFSLSFCNCFWSSIKIVKIIYLHISKAVSYLLTYFR